MGVETGASKSGRICSGEGVSLEENGKVEEALREGGRGGNIVESVWEGGRVGYTMDAVSEGGSGG